MQWPLGLFKLFIWTTQKKCFKVLRFLLEAIQKYLSIQISSIRLSGIALSWNAGWKLLLKVMQDMSSKLTPSANVKSHKTFCYLRWVILKQQLSTLILVTFGNHFPTIYFRQCITIIINKGLFKSVKRPPNNWGISDRTSFVSSMTWCCHL